MELKQAYAAAKKRREMDSMLMTRAYREKLAGGKTQKGTYIYAVIRIRLPEGLLLQVIWCLLIHILCMLACLHTSVLLMWPDCATLAVSTKATACRHASGSESISSAESPRAR